jgi:hypothetical protein
MKFNLAGIAEILVQYVSNLVNMILPGELGADGIRGVQTAYALAKIWGPHFVEQSSNTLDDAVLGELLEICEEAAKKFNFDLNPLEL